MEGRRQWHSTPVLLPGKSHGWRSLVGCSPRGPEESDTAEQLHFHFSLPCTGEGNGNPLQCSCLENPRDGVAWWAAVYGVTQSRTQLKRFSSSLTSIVGYNLWAPVSWRAVEVLQCICQFSDHICQCLIPSIYNYFQISIDLSIQKHYSIHKCILSTHGFSSQLC